eukprot:gene53180-biopygen37535
MLLVAFPRFLPPTRRYYFAVGGDMAGLQFHKHAQAWAVQVYGRKRWLLYPPHDMPLPHYPPFNTVEFYAKSLRGKLAPSSPCPLPDIGFRGSFTNVLLYVPELWYHSTLSIGESVAVAGQSDPETELQQLYDDAVHRIMFRSDQAPALRCFAGGWP